MNPVKYTEYRYYDYLKKCISNIHSHSENHFNNDTSELSLREYLQSIHSEVKNLLKSNSFNKRLKGLIFKLNVYGLTFASLIISCVLIPHIVISRNIVDVNEINDFVTYGIIEDL